MAKRDYNEPSGWVGWIVFAGLMMVLLGSFNAVVGLVALFNPDWIAVTQGNVLLFDLTSWGWWHLVLGIVVAIAGFQVMMGSGWARVVGVVVASFNALGAMATIDTYPWWSLLVLFLDVMIIYALTVHGGEMEE